jgi:hypothetical protein
MPDAGGVHASSLSASRAGNFRSNRCARDEPARRKQVLTRNGKVAVYVADLSAREPDAHPQDLTSAELRESDRACLDTFVILQQFAEFRQLAAQVHR